MNKKIEKAIKNLYNDLVTTLLQLSNVEDSVYEYGIWKFKDSYHVCDLKTIKDICYEGILKYKKNYEEYKRIKEEINEDYDNSILVRKANYIYNEINEIYTNKGYYLRNGFEYPYEVIDYEDSKLKAINVLKYLKQCDNYYI